jgi:hypothetical protein
LLPRARPNIDQGEISLSTASRTAEPRPLAVLAEVLPLDRLAGAEPATDHAPETTISESDVASQSPAGVLEGGDASELPPANSPLPSQMPLIGKSAGGESAVHQTAGRIDDPIPPVEKSPQAPMPLARAEGEAAKIASTFAAPPEADDEGTAVPETVFQDPIEPSSCELDPFNTLGEVAGAVEAIVDLKDDGISIGERNANSEEVGPSVSGEGADLNAAATDMPTAGPDFTVSQARSADEVVGSWDDDHPEPMDASPDRAAAMDERECRADGELDEAEAGFSDAADLLAQAHAESWTDSDAEADEAHDLPDAPALDGGIASKPSVYRPRLKRARPRRVPAAPAAPRQADSETFEADLQIFFGPGDWGMEVAALLALPRDMDEVAVVNSGEETLLGALDDQLLEPLLITDSALALGEPLLITAVGLPVRWSRASRDLHVLGQHQAVAGFVSRPRVAIGQENAVICRDRLADEALAQILATGSGAPIRIEGPGVPAGWICWRGIRPVRPSIPKGGPASLHALDPLPAVSYDLTGGLQLSRGIWLESNPPTIRLLGMMSSDDPVLIDGRAAVQGEDGSWWADGWDHVGSHRIEHGGVTAGYMIDAGVNEWEWWPAWQGAAALAGALAETGGGEYFHAGPPATLIGARPGEICGISQSVRGVCIAHPGFDPVWIITAGTGIRRAKASLIGAPTVPGTPILGAPAATSRWARAICASGRAGSANSAERRIWDRYVAAARTSRRRSR